jgi:hypothetical protein
MAMTADQVETSEPIRLPAASNDSAVMTQQPAVARPQFTCALDHAAT